MLRNWARRTERTGATIRAASQRLGLEPSHTGSSGGWCATRKPHERRWCTELPGWLDASYAATLLPRHSNMMSLVTSHPAHATMSLIDLCARWGRGDAATSRCGWTRQLSQAGWLRGAARLADGPLLEPGDRVGDDPTACVPLGPVITEELVCSVLALLGLSPSVPDHSTLSRRGKVFASRCPRALPSSGPIGLVSDNGPWLFGQGE